MKRTLRVASAVALLVFFKIALAQQSPSYHPGLEPFTPTRIDWLATLLEANLRIEDLSRNGYLLRVVESGPETLTIYIRYLPTVNREVMNTQIDAVRKVIAIDAKSYGWDGWIRVTEDVRLQKQGN
jgi:hypothetical protein